MATQPTNQPVPSESPRDLKFNAGKIDEFVTSEAHEYIDRFGGKHRTIHGIDYDANQAILNYGYITKDSFEDGSTLSIANECLRWKSNGEYYRWDGSFPKVVPPGSTPDSTGGIGKGKWVGVGDASLRSDLKSSGDELGDKLINASYGTPNSSEITQHDINKQVVSIIKFGGKPDGATYTELALQKIKEDIGSNVCVVFPKIGDQSVYYFSGTYDPSDTAGFTFDCEPGVSLSVGDISGIDESVTFVNDTPAICWALGNCKFTFPGSSKKFAQGRPIWHIEPDYSSLYPINPSLTGASAVLEYTQFDQRNDTQTAISPSAVSNDGVVFSNSDPYLGQYGLARISSGEEISAWFSATTGATATYSGMIVTGNSRYWFICGVTNTGAVFVQSKINGSGLVSAALQYEGQTTHDSYRLASSLVTLRKDSDSHFSLLLNGYCVWETDTSAPIVKMGFGSVGGSGSVTIGGWVHRRHLPVDKGKIIGISVFGDSVTDKRNYGAWPGLMQNMLDANNGIRVANVYNYAVSGASSAGQLPFVTAENLSKSNVALILLGVNDIQGGVSVASYIANMTTIIDTCRANANIPIVGMPTMWYGKGQTQPPSGQNSSNYSAGAPYRSALLRLCAEKSVKFVDLCPVLGPVLGNWYNTGLGIPFGDQTVFDNIHPTSNSRFLIARAFASAIIGFYSTDRDDAYSGLLPTSGLASGWTMGTNPVGYSIDNAGRVFFHGTFHQPFSSPITDGTVMYTLPENLRPRADTWIPVANEYTTCRVFIGANDGNVKVYGMTGGLLLSMDGVVLHTRTSIVKK